MDDFLIDTHCHLNLGNLNENLDEIISNAHKNRVKYLHAICTKIDEFSEVRSISEKYENVFCSVGVHPDNCKENIVTALELIELSKNPRVISFGETGLDYYHEGFNRTKQMQSFINHINASQSEGLPVIIHTRDAGIDTMEILSSEMKNAKFSGIIHCFTENYEFATKALDLGLYISVAGIVTFKNANALQDTVKKLPLDRILVETDAPYLAPMPHRGKRNEPAYVLHTAEFLANLFGISLEDISKITTENARRIFSKPSLL